MHPSPLEQNFDHVALIPERVLRAHAVHQPYDTRFRSAARLLQALWREDRELPIGSYVNASGKKVRLGSRLSAAAGLQGANFLSPAIAHLVQRELCYREIGALIDEERLLTNTLSSMPLTFNLLGPCKLDLTLATALLRALLPAFDGSVTEVLFEHAPARSNPAFTDDRTAFDALIRYTTAAGRRGFVAFEVKYSESCAEPVPPLKARYADLSRETGLFIEPNAPHLRTNPLQQLWREHSLSQCMVQRGLYDEGSFCVISPELNHLAQNAIGAYRCQLLEPTGAQVPFVSWTLESVIQALHAAGAEQHARALYRRYADFWLVDGEIELALSDPGYGKPSRPMPKPCEPASAASVAAPRQVKRKTAAAAAN